MAHKLSIQNLKSDEKGATLLETAVGLVPFTIILFAMLQVLSFAHTTMSMHYALAKAARWGVLNLTLNDQNMNQLDRVASIKQRFAETAPRYGVNPDAVTVKICPADQPDCTVESAGAAGRPFIIKGERRARFLTGFQFLQPKTSVIISNEPL